MLLCVEPTPVDHVATDIYVDKLAEIVTNKALATLKIYNLNEMSLF